MSSKESFSKKGLFEFYSITSRTHILNYKVGGAVVDESTAGFLIIEERANLFLQYLLSVIIEDCRLILLNDLEALIEIGVPKLLTHKSFEFREITR